MAGWLSRALPACLIFALSTTAQTSLNLRGAVDTALASHPLLEAGSNRIAAAQGFLLQASLRPNPRAIFQTENWRWWSTPAFRPSADPDTFLYGSQLFETGGKRARRIDVSTAALRRAELERELTAKVIVGRVKSAYWQAAGAQRVHELLLESVAAFDEIVRYHADRVREGAMAEADLIRVRLERERVFVTANSAGLDAERARINLLREMGQSSYPAGLKLTETPSMGEPAPPPELEQAFANRTEVKLANQLVDQLRANLRLQRALAQPDIEAFAGYKRTNGVDTLMGGATLDVPVFNRNQGSVAAAGAEIRTAESELAAARAVVAAEVRAALAEVRTRERQLREMFPRILEQARQSAVIAEAAYREGGSDLLRLLDAQQTRINTEVLYFRTLAEYRQSLAALETAVGMER